MYHLDSKSAIMLLLLTPMLLVMSLAIPAEASEALADVNGVAISNEEVEQALGAPLAKLQEQMYAMKRRMLEVFINQRLLASEAAKRGVLRYGAPGRRSHRQGRSRDRAGDRNPVQRP